MRILHKGVMLVRIFFQVACIASLLLIASVDVFSQSGLEEYNKELLLELHWGDEPDEIGFEMGTIFDMGTYIGPMCFDIDSDKNIYFLDTVHDHIKIFNKKGELIQSFPIEDAGREEGWIAVDENHDIWHHDSFKKVFRKYTFEGSLKKTILYHDDVLPPGFEIRDGEINFRGTIVIEPDTTSSETGQSGQPVYEARVTYSMNEEEKPYSPGNYSGRKYYQIYREENSGPEFYPNMHVMNTDGSITALYFEGVHPNYIAYLFAEDKYDNVYIQLVYPGLEHPTQIWKYDSNLHLIGKIEDFPRRKRDFGLRKQSMVDKDGTIYFLNLPESSVQLYTFEFSK